MFALRRDSSKARFCVVGIFYFVNSRKGPFAGWNVSGRDYQFFAQNSRISHFQCGHLPKHSSVNSAPHGTSSQSTLVCGKFDFLSLEGNPPRAGYARAHVGLSTRLVPSDGCPVILLIVRETLPAGSCREGGLLSSWSLDRTCRTCLEERRLECVRLFGSRGAGGL